MTSEAMLLEQVAFEPATFTRIGDDVLATISLILDNRVEEVWAALTEAERLPQWLAPGQIEPREGGAARLDFADSGTVIDSEVTLWRPLHELEYSWSQPGEPRRPIRWSLEPIGPETRLELHVTTPAGEDAARAAAGWAAHLEMLAATLAGAQIKFPFEVFKAAREAYRAQLAG